MRAFCYRSGLIVFSGCKSVDGALPIAAGPAKQLRRAVSQLAVHCFDGALIVPRLPEARNWPERSAAMVRFTAAVQKALGNDTLARKIANWDRRVARRGRSAGRAA